MAQDFSYFYSPASYFLIPNIKPYTKMQSCFIKPMTNFYATKAPKVSEKR